jgi:glycosyltransferase involved in cell wall biosynthesis
MKLVNYISNLDPRQQTGGWNGVNASLHAELGKHFEVNFIGPINPGSDYPAKAVSKLRRKSGLAGSFHFFSERRLRKIASLIENEAAQDAEIDFFHGSTPWVLFDSPRPYFVYVDTFFSTYVNVYHDARKFLETDLNRIFQVEARWLARAATVFFGTEWALEQVVTDYKIPRANLKAVGAAGSMAIPESDKYAGGINLLFIAFDFQQKGGPICVEAFRKVREKFSEAQLTIVGGRPSTEILELPGVRYEGFLSKSVPAELNRLEELYQNAFVLVHPTTSDIQPLVISEAGYCGCPTIAPRSFGIPDLIQDGVTGCLVDLPLTAEAFAKRILDLCNDRATYCAMRTAVREHSIATQTWPAIGERIVQEMRSVQSASQLQVSHQA